MTQNCSSLLNYKQQTWRTCSTKQGASHRELLLLHWDPASEGVSAARSIHVGVVEKLMLRFCAQSMMHGLPDTLNMIGGLTLGTTACSKDRPTACLDRDVSVITCKY